MTQTSEADLPAVPAQKPSIGRVVHYWPGAEEEPERKSTPYPAVITHVWSDTCVNLCVMQDGSFPIRSSTPTSVVFVEHPRQGEQGWTWPQRV